MDELQIKNERSNFYRYLERLSNWGIITREEHDRFKRKIDEELERLSDVKSNGGIT